LDRCRVAGRYRYQGFTRKTDVLDIRNGNQLEAALPVGSALDLQAELRDGGALRVEMTLAGTWDAEPSSDGMAQVEGACDGATHVVAGMTVGAFSITKLARSESGAGAGAFGAKVGAHRVAQESKLVTDGDDDACSSSGARDSSPPDGCGAPVRLQLLSLADAAKKATCSSSTRWDGKRCTSDGSLLPLLLLLAL
jgi:hypothetical protein